uniref:Uncharacterized protein n=1 Tax=Plectus sambesii TaxID=2011161 RepID=A0A914XS42_9BILA
MKSQSAADIYATLTSDDDCESIIELNSSKFYTDRNIKRFYLPLLLPRSIDVNNIVAVYHEPHNRRDLRICRDWGLSLAGVRWAADGRRVFWINPKRSNVTLKMKKEKFHIGFTIEHIEDFLQTLQLLLPSGVEIECEFPYFKKSEAEYQRLTM